MKKIKDFENHQEKVIQEMRERFRIYKKKKGSDKK
jgi:inorganic pyrophosphatase